MTATPPLLPTEPPVQPEDAAGFNVFTLDERLLEAVAGLGFDTPTAVQQCAIPALLAGRDVIGRARTGSGKTAAFGLPLIDRVKEGGSARALVLTPTRELALQVGDALRSFAKRIKGVRIATVYGGAPYPPQLKALRSGASVVVGTPGRIIDHLDRGSLDLSAVEYFVLDEADEMLRMGFLDDVEKLLLATPKTRQVALFSATMPEAIRRVAHKHLKDPIELQVEDRALSVGHIKQRWLRVPERNQLDALIRVLRGVAHGTTLVFARTRAGCAELADALDKRGVPVEALHGDLNQAARERVVEGLRSRRLRVVIATDVAARGIDVDHITHVINLELPPDAESYVHRIGRTGRAGREGTAISFVTPRAVGRLGRLRQTLQVPLEAMDVPSDADIARIERGRLVASLRQAASKASTEGAKALLDEAVAAGPHSLEELAAAATYLLAQSEHISLREVVDDGPPAWATVRDRRSRDPRMAPRGDRGPARQGGDDTQQAQLLFPLGFTRGVRPADIVGLLANEAGVQTSAIGRITIVAHKSFVGVSESVAQQVMQLNRKMNLRGVMIRISLAEQRGERPPPRTRERGPARASKDRSGPPQRDNFGPPRERSGPRGATSKPQDPAGSPAKASTPPAPVAPPPQQASTPSTPPAKTSTPKQASMPRTDVSSPAQQPPTAPPEMSTGPRADSHASAEGAALDGQQRSEAPRGRPQAAPKRSESPRKRSGAARERSESPRKRSGLARERARRPANDDPRPNREHARTADAAGSAVEIAGAPIERFGLAGSQPPKRPKRPHKPGVQKPNAHKPGANKPAAHKKRNKRPKTS